MHMGKPSDVHGEHVCPISPSLGCIACPDYRGSIGQGEKMVCELTAPPCTGFRLDPAGIDGALGPQVMEDPQ